MVLDQMRERKEKGEVLEKGEVEMALIRAGLKGLGDAGDKVGVSGAAAGQGMKKTVSSSFSACESARSRDDRCPERSC